MATPEERALQLPDNNNWHDEEDVLVNDQAVGLPDVGTYNLYKITPPHKEREDLDKWIDKVDAAVQVSLPMDWGFGSSLDTKHVDLFLSRPLWIQTVISWSLRFL
ncbi:hypothetical protein ACN38_g1599 [Penicillium nordicum]|uniref:Uncharacterized protein n=1 Tax=Penicillium nordicum TaxID=229535 RepID=A0A0M9WJM6_9EURO|nr:hypothetical protein ACN38_g1599 [Penicillium nordicum]